MLLRCFLGKQTLALSMGCLLCCAGCAWDTDRHLHPEMQPAEVSQFAARSGFSSGVKNMSGELISWQALCISICKYQFLHKSDTKHAMVHGLSDCAHRRRGGDEPHSCWVADSYPISCSVLHPQSSSSTLSQYRDGKKEHDFIVGRSVLFGCNCRCPTPLPRESLQTHQPSQDAANN